METTQTEVKPLNNIAGVTANARVVKRRSPSLKRAATKSQKEITRGFPLPLILTCTKTGKVNKYTSLTYIRSLIAKHGDLETLRKNYVCSSARK